MKRHPPVHLLTIVAAVAVCVGCKGNPAGDPTTLPTTQPEGDAGVPAPSPPRPLPEPQAALAHLDRLLRDDSRRVEVYKDAGGELDDAARKSLRAAQGAWWQTAAVERAGKPWKLTPDMWIVVYSKGSANSARPDDAVVAQVQIFRARQLARVTFTDPQQPALSDAVYYLQSPGPAEWVTRLFAGQL